MTTPYIPTYYTATFSGGRCVQTATTPATPAQARAAYAGAVSGMGEDARQQRIEQGDECPDCGSRDTESNGSTEYRCCGCDHRWGREGGRNGEPYGY